MFDRNGSLDPDDMELGSSIKAQPLRRQSGAKVYPPIHVVDSNASPLPGSPSPAAL